VYDLSLQHLNKSQNGEGRGEADCKGRWDGKEGIMNGGRRTKFAYFGGIFAVRAASRPTGAMGLKGAH